MFGKGQAPFAHSVDSSFSAKLFGWYIICLGLIISLFICVDVCIGVYVGGYINVGAMCERETLMRTWKPEEDMGCPVFSLSSLFY